MYDDILAILRDLPTISTEAHERAQLRDRLRDADYRGFVAEEEAKLLAEYAQKGQPFITEVYDEVKLPDGRMQIARPVKCKACRLPYMRGYLRVANPATKQELEITYQMLHAIEQSHPGADHSLIGKLEEILSKEIVKLEAEKAYDRMLLRKQGAGADDYLVE